MYVNNQTLFYVGIGTLDVEMLYDLKTLSSLYFGDKEDAIEFCRIFNETKCIEELKNNKPHEEDYIYLEYDKVRKLHKVMSLFKIYSIEYITSKLVKKLVKEHSIVNLENGNNGKIRIKWTVSQTKETFKEEIKNKYNQFLNNMKLIGKDQSFEYTIIGEYVILTKISDNDEVVVPEFVTSLSASAYIFNEPSILKIPNGVKFIGSDIINEDITKIIGGNTLEYIGNIGTEIPVIVLKKI